MAQLKRSKNDSHLYILAGPSQGTWQINEEGVSWLRSRGYSIPAQERSVSVDAGTFHRLKAEGYLDTLHIPYEQHDFPAQSDGDKPAPAGLPLFLRLVELQNPPWELAVELSVLFEDEMVWAELQRLHPDFVTLNYSPQLLPLRQLHNTLCLVKVWPQALPYLVQWEDEQHKRHTLQGAAVTSGLIGGWQGNVFVEKAQKRGLWQRCHPNSTISFYGTFLWIAKTGHEPEWPGHTLTVGQPYMGWQLWRLELNDSASVTWERVERWFRYRSIDVLHQRQRLQVISPPGAVTDDDWYISIPGQPLLIQCTPPRRQMKGIARYAYLSAGTFSNDASRRARAYRSDSDPVPAEQVSYFRWLAPRPGQYSIRLEGDAAAEELLIRASEQSVVLPPWLCGIRCTVTSARTQQTFRAFKDMSEAGLHDERDILNAVAPQDLSTLMWRLDPDGIPMCVSWEYVSVQGVRHTDRINPTQSGEELTAHWQERIWPMIAASAKAIITLDAGSFGLIELSLTPTPPKDKGFAWWTDERLTIQFTWLGYAIERRHDQTQVAVPASLRKDISQLRMQAVAQPSLCTSLDRLARIDAAPPWILVRLQMLIAEIQKTEAHGRLTRRWEANTLELPR